MERKTKAGMGIVAASATFLIGYGELKGQVSQHEKSIGAYHGEMKEVVRYMHKIDRKVDVIGAQGGSAKKLEAIDDAFDKESNVQDQQEAN